ncbi:unnamed protein product, partial [Ixodes pacificus]
HTQQKPGKRKCQPVNCRVDTGADCCVISERLLHTLTNALLENSVYALVLFSGMYRLQMARALCTCSTRGVCRTSTSTL